MSTQSTRRSNAVQRTLTITGMFAIGAAVIASSGCAFSRLCASNGKARPCQINKHLAKANEKLDRLHAEFKVRQADLDRYHQDAELTRAELARLREFDGSSATLPPGAASGECFARVYVPPAYATVTEQVLKRDAYDKVEVIPAQYGWGEERILVKEASTYLEPVPAEYKTVTETVLVQAARDEWHKGRGLVEKVDHATGEIMCRVHVPAEYKNIEKRVLVKPAGVREVHVPAEYKMVKVQTLVAPARTERVTFPAEYQTVSKTVATADGRIEWRRVLCETNLAGNVVNEIKVALQDAGHDPGPVNGQVNKQFLDAVEEFQESSGLPVGGLTHETLAMLGTRIDD